jgi:S1-C subfamily serine protease
MTTQGYRTVRRAAWLAGVFVLLLAPTARPQVAPASPPAGVEALADRAGRSVVTVFAQRTVTRTATRAGSKEPVSRVHTRVGTGVAVEEHAILTTASVVLGSERVIVYTSNGLEAEAEPVGMDLVFNLALLRVPDLQLPWLRPAAIPAQLGDRVIAVGTSYRAQATQSVGMVEYVYREPRSSLLQLTNIVYPGNSGAAALNTQGELVGIVQGELGPPNPGVGAGSFRRPNGTSFVMPIQQVWPVYESLKRDGRMRHGYLGVSTRAEVVRSEIDNAEVALGARVESVQAGGPAARVGLRPRDLIVGFENERVEYPEQLARWVAETPPKTVVTLVWAHGDERRSGRVSLAESRDSLPAWALGGLRWNPAPGPMRAPGRSPRR